MCVVGDVCLAEGVESLFECAVVVVFVVGDVVEPRCCDGVECETSRIVFVYPVLLDDESGRFSDGLHMCVAVRVVSVGAYGFDELG